MKWKNQSNENNYRSKIDEIDFHNYEQRLDIDDKIKKLTCSRE